MKKILSFILILSIIVGCFTITPVYASTEESEMVLLGNNSNLSWKTYSAECESQEIKFEENVAVNKLYLKITGVYSNYYKIREFEVLDANGENVLLDSVTKERKVTVSYEGGMPSDLYHRVCDGIISEDVTKPDYERTSVSTTDLQNEYIEFTFEEPVNIASVRLWCNYCKQTSFWTERGNAPKTWEVYGDNLGMFYDGFNNDFKYWSDTDNYTLANGAVMPNPNAESVMYTVENSLKDYRAEAELLGLSGEMGLISHYTDDNHCYRAIIDKSQNKLKFYKGTSLLVEKNWLFGGTAVIAITVNAEKVSVWVDEVKMLDYIDASPLSSGKIGLYANHSTGAFERASIHKLGVDDTLPGDYPYELTPNAIGQAPVEGMFYVAENGNDSWEGTLERPFVTIQKAIEAVRIAKENNPNVDYTVILRGGTYYLDSTIQMTSEDGGTGDYRVTYAAYPDETPIISGGKEIITEWYEQGNGIWMTTLSNELKDTEIQGLFVENESAIRSDSSNLDTQGEWFYNQTENRLYYYSINNENPNNLTMIIPYLKHLVSLTGTKENPVTNIDFYGIRFCHTVGSINAEIDGNEVSDVALLYINACKNRIQNCDFTMLGKGAIAFGAGANSNLVYGSTFTGTEGNCVQVGCIHSCDGAEYTLNCEWENNQEVPRGNEIVNNYFDGCGTADSGFAAIWLGYANHSLVENNTIKNMPYANIAVGWKGTEGLIYSHHNSVVWNHVEKDVVYAGEQYCNETSDNSDVAIEPDGNTFGCTVGTLGDVNYDESTDILDLARFKKYAADQTIKIDKIVSDLESDSKINQNDLLKLRDLLVEGDEEPVTEDTLATYGSQLTGNPQFSGDNLLYSAKTSTTGNAGTIRGICDGDTYPYDSGSVSETSEEFTFIWDSSVTADTLRLYANYAKDQAPAHLKVYVQQGNGRWNWINNCQISWGPMDGKYFEYVDIPVRADNISGLKVVVEEANLTWNHYVIAEMELLTLKSNKEGYKLIFSDEFNEEDVNTDKWLTQYFPHATETPEGCQTTYKMRNGSLCLYIDENTPNYGYHTTMKASNVQTFEKNLLHPGAGETNRTDVEPYESFTCQYGYFEMRAKLPNCGGGGHVAWWLIGTQDDAQEDGTGSVQTGEIDILETTLLRTNTFSPKVHAWGDTNLSEYENEVVLQGDYSNEYHIYAMDWKPSGLTFYVDGKVIGTTSSSPQYRMAMFLGIYTDCGGWSGDANSVYPKEFCIDYVRVYQDVNGYVD